MVFVIGVIPELNKEIPAKVSDEEITTDLLNKLSISLLFSSEIIIKQLFASGSVNIVEFLPRLRLSKYSPIFTQPSANNC